MGNRSSHPQRDVNAEILAAARECIIERGVTRTTVAEVARRAGAARPTVYHRYDNVDMLARAVLTSEVMALQGGVVHTPSTAEELVEQLVLIADRARESDFLTALVSHDASLLAEYQFNRLGESQVSAVAALASLMRNIRRKELHATTPSQPMLRDADPDTLAVFTLGIMQSAVLSAAAISPHLPPDDTWRRELLAVLKGYLAP